MSVNREILKHASSYLSGLPPVETLSFSTKTNTKITTFPAGKHFGQETFSNNVITTFSSTVPLSGSGLTFDIAVRYCHYTPPRLELPYESVRVSLLGLMITEYRYPACQFRSVAEVVGEREELLEELPQAQKLSVDALISYASSAFDFHARPLNARYPANLPDSYTSNS